MPRLEFALRQLIMQFSCVQMAPRTSTFRIKEISHLARSGKAEKRSGFTQDEIKQTLQIV